MSFENEMYRERKPFNLVYFREIIEMFIDKGFRSETHHDYFLSNPEEVQLKLLLRFDVDGMPERIPGLLKIMREFNIVSTFFWQIHGPYNPFFHENYQILKDISADGHEIGLHSNFLEFANYFDEDPVDIIKREKLVMEAVIGKKIFGHSCHREVNYEFNSLPFLNSIGAKNLGFEYSAYDPIFNSDKTIYVNEGLNPHLSWRSISPEESVVTGKNVCLLLHPHWWHDKFHVGI
jgi:peptidoglycan/xylan/chitin deacetylase (PgdA/CDA1 family)